MGSATEILSRFVPVRLVVEIVRGIQAVEDSSKTMPRKPPETHIEDVVLTAIGVAGAERQRAEDQIAIREMRRRNRRLVSHSPGFLRYFPESLTCHKVDRTLELSSAGRRLSARKIAAAC